MTTDNPASPQREIAPGVEANDAVWAAQSDAVEAIVREALAEHCPNGKWLTGPNTLAMAIGCRVANMTASSADVWRERCEALEAAKARWDQLMSNLAKEAESAERALAAAKALPGKWRENSARYTGAEGKIAALIVGACADQLEAALGQRAAMGNDNG